jgi:hypothetical protein
VRSITRQTDQKVDAARPTSSQNKIGQENLHRPLWRRADGKVDIEMGSIVDAARKQTELDIRSQVQSLSCPPLSQ